MSWLGLFQWRASLEMTSHRCSNQPSPTIGPDVTELEYAEIEVRLELEVQPHRVFKQLAKANWPSLPSGQQAAKLRARS
eukprot:15134638-Alexandrium_andersonii.AAC.1